MTDAEMRQMAREALAEALTRMGLTLSPEAMGNRSLALAEITDRITGATVPTPRAKFFPPTKVGLSLKKQGRNSGRRRISRPEVALESRK